MSEPCIKEKEFGKIEEAINLMTREVFGNGQKGLIKTVPRLEDKIDGLILTQAGILTNISALVKFQTEIVSVENFKQKERSYSIRKTAVIISVILSLGAIVTSVIIKFI
jgi:uncharacterized metal-binding protein